MLAHRLVMSSGLPQSDLNDVNAVKARRFDELVFFVFDLLYGDGYDLRNVSLERRKDLLAAVLGNSGAGPVRHAGRG